jgi:hypothetical protein
VLPTVHTVINAVAGKDALHLLRTIAVSADHVNENGEPDRCVSEWYKFIVGSGCRSKPAARLSHCTDILARIPF